MSFHFRDELPTNKQRPTILTTEYVNSIQQLLFITVSIFTFKKGNLIIETLRITLQEFVDNSK